MALPDALIAAVKAAGPGYAVFDADGTLWRDDVGEAFLRHLVALGKVKLPDGRDPFEAYQAAVERDRQAGYAYAAQLLAGLPAAQVQAEAMRFAARWAPPRLLASTDKLLTACRAAGLVPVVVSASQIDIVRAAVVHAGIAWDLCAGISTVVAPDGRYTAEVQSPITYAAGKVVAARQRGWTPIAVAAGDSAHGDLALLEAAKVAVAVAAAGESPLSAEAKQRGWTVIGSP